MQIEKVYFNSIDNLNLIGLLHTPKKKTKTVGAKRPWPRQ